METTVKKTNSVGTRATKKAEGLLITVARTIGSTLGTVAAKTGVATPSHRRKAIKKSRPKPQKKLQGKPRKTKTPKTRGMIKA
jgi:hypothetical protein